MDEEIEIDIDGDPDGDANSDIIEDEVSNEGEKVSLYIDGIDWAIDLSTQTVHVLLNVALDIHLLYHFIELDDKLFVEKSYNTYHEILETSIHKEYIENRNRIKNNKKCKPNSSQSVKTVFKNQLMIRYVVFDPVTEKRRNIVIFIYKSSKSTPDSPKVSVNVLGTINEEEIYMIFNLLLEQVIKKNAIVYQIDEAKIQKEMIEKNLNELKIDETFYKEYRVVTSNLEDLFGITVTDLEIMYDNLIVNFNILKNIKLQNLYNIADDRLKFMMNDPSTNSVRFKFTTSTNNIVHIHFKRTGKCNINRTKSIDEAKETIRYLYNIFQKKSYNLEVEDKHLIDLNHSEANESITDILKIVSNYSPFYT